MTAYRTQSRKARNAKSANGFRSIAMVKVFMSGLLSIFGFQSICGSAKSFAFSALVAMRIRSLEFVAFRKLVSFGAMCEKAHFLVRSAIVSFCRGDDFFVRKTGFVPIDDRMNLNAGKFGQVRGRMTNPSNFQPDRISPVSGLPLARLPAAVIWAVWAIVVDAVKSHAWRSVTHILGKVPERHPSFADGDSSAAIVRVRLVPRAKASSPHVVPCAVQRVIGNFVFNFSGGHKLPLVVKPASYTI